MNGYSLSSTQTPYIPLSGKRTEEKEEEEDDDTASEGSLNIDLQDDSPLPVQALPNGNASGASFLGKQPPQITIPKDSTPSEMDEEISRMTGQKNRPSLTNSMSGSVIPQPLQAELIREIRNGRDTPGICLIF